MHRLTEDQSSALRLLRGGENVFLTGAAGTGKTYVLETYMDECREQGKVVLAMAPTGIAARSLKDGLTIHGALSLAPGVLDPKHTFKRGKRILEAADVVVIDEISMVRIDLFERFCQFFKMAEQTTGKKQLIVVGDFFQLPPVVTYRETDALGVLFPGCEPYYCFLSSRWDGLELVGCVLREIVRQHDKDFYTALAQARLGDDACIDYLAKRVVDRRVSYDESAIWLCGHKGLVNRLNTEGLDSLDGGRTTYHAYSSGEVYDTDLKTNEALVLKNGARVMTLVNDASKLYYNGSFGTVLSCEDDFVCVEFDNGNILNIPPYTWYIKNNYVSGGARRGYVVRTETVGTFTQIPLQLAYATTIHKSQGQTFSKVNLNVDTFDSGQLYVGLSRCSDIEGLYIYPELKSEHLLVSERVKDFYARLDLY